MEINNQEAIEVGQAIEAMSNSKGWKHLNDYMTEQCNLFKNALVHERDIQKFLRMQEIVKAYEDVQNYVTVSIEEGKRLSSEKSEQTHDETRYYVG